MPNGYCEDAPACGCCGPQGDGDYYGVSAMEAAMEPSDPYDDPDYFREYPEDYEQEDEYAYDN